MLLGFGKSLVKAGKYVGLTVAGAAVMGAAGVFDSASLAQALLDAGFSEVLTPFVANYLGPLVGGYLAIALQQLIAHRDKLFSPPE